jgi:chromosome segregation ATPase
MGTISDSVSLGATARVRSVVRGSLPPLEGLPTNGGPLVSRESLKADLAGAQARANRLQARVYHLEKRLSQALGEQVWQEAGLGTAADIDALQRQVATLEQQMVELNRRLDERDLELAAACAANRELMIGLNA